VGSYVVYLSDRSIDGPSWVHMVSVDRSTDDPVSYASPPNLIRWAGGLYIAGGLIGHTVHFYS